MRWDDLFAALEAEADDLDRRNRDADIADRTRSAQAQQSWLARCGGQELAVRVAGAGVLRGVPDRVATAWLLLRTGGSTDWIVSTAAVLSVSGLSEVAVSGALLDERLGWTHVWRVLSRDRSEVRVVCSDGTVVRGVPEAVGRDYVEVRAYDAGRPVGRTTEAVPYAAIAAVGCPA
ncbi:MAG: hypothetical protein ACRDO7_03710 [Nocardioidaceae bacterium]